MAGNFTALFQQAFTSQTTFTVTHNLDRLQVGVLIRIDDKARNDLIESVSPDPANPRGATIVTLTSSQSGIAIFVDTDFVFANIPEPESAAIISSAIHDDVAAEVNAITVKGTPIAADLLLIEDSAGGTFDKKKITIGSLPGGGSGDVVGPGVAVDKGMVVFSGTTGKIVADSGLRHYGASATDPSSPTPAGGDSYYNTVLNMLMFYDGSRSKWLSSETVELWFGRNGNTGAGSYYRGPGNKQYETDIGRTAEYNGTVISIAYTRDDTDAATFVIEADGVSKAELASSAVKGIDVTLDGDFNALQVLSARNKSGGNQTTDVHGWARIKWRAT